MPADKPRLITPDIPGGRSAKTRLMMEPFFDFVYSFEGDGFLLDRGPEN